MRDSPAGNGGLERLLTAAVSGVTKMEVVSAAALQTKVKTPFPEGETQTNKQIKQ